MIVVMRADDYTIYKKRNQRYAVRGNEDKQWITGDRKVAILLAHNLIPGPTVQAPDHPEPAAGESAEASEEGGGAAPAEE